jgi:hypothetical protein
LDLALSLFELGTKLLSLSLLSFKLGLALFFLDRLFLVLLLGFAILLSLLTTLAKLFGSSISTSFRRVLVLSLCKPCTKISGQPI